MSGPYCPDRRQLFALSAGIVGLPAVAAEQKPAPRKRYPFKKSINLWAFPYPEKMSLETCLKLAKEAGFDGIELNYDLESELSPKSGPKEFGAIRRLAERIGISISGMCSFLFWPYPLTSNDPAKRSRGLELAGKIAEAAAELGTENVLVVPGAVCIPWRTDHEPVRNDICDKRAREAIKSLIPAAEKLNVYLNKYKAIRYTRPRRPKLANYRQAKPVQTTTAYSYIRFSNPEQAAGDSLRRQSERASEYSGQRGWKLDDTLTLRDLGVSAFRGKNAIVGHLRVFLDAIKSSKVVPGSALIVESFDRISRQGIDEGYDLVKSILKAGVKIVTLSPEREFNVDATKSLSKGALEIQLILERAAEESERKSERVGSAWARKQREAGQKAVTRRVPVWLRVVGGEGKKIKDTAPGEVRYELHPAKAELVRRMFREAIDGAGAFAIAKKLNAEHVPYIGREVFKGKAVAWNRTLIYQILTSTATIGTYTPYKCPSTGRKAQGEPVPGYFPAVVDEATYYRAQVGIASRKKVGRGRRGQHVNLFAGLLRDARSGGPMTYSNRKHNSIVIPQNAVEVGNATWVSFNAKCLEFAILAKMKELTAKDVADADTYTDAAKKFKDAEGRLAKVEALRGAWQAKMDDLRIINTVATKLAELDGEYRRAIEDREAAKREMATPSADAIDEVNTLADHLTKDNSDKTRLKVRSALRAVIESVTVLAITARKGTRTRYAAVRVQFKGDNHRDYVIRTSHPRGQQYPTYDAESFADAGLPDADLREPKQAAKLESLLVKHISKQ